MCEEPAPTATLPCPRCGGPIVWDRRDHGGGPTVEVRRAGCGCALAPDQWADLAERANALLDAWEETPG